MLENYKQRLRGDGCAGAKAPVSRASSSGAPAPQGQAGRDALSLSPQEKGHNGRCRDLQLLLLSLGHGNGRVGISSWFYGAKGEVEGDGGAVL